MAARKRNNFTDSSEIKKNSFDETIADYNENCDINIPKPLLNGYNYEQTNGYKKVSKILFLKCHTPL